MNHYYTNNKDLESKPRTFSYGFKGNILEFTSDIGVFSKDGIDFGTNLLLKSLPDLDDAKSAIDVGCGVGIIGICLNKKYPNMDVLMVDVNDRAIDLANLICYNLVS